MRARAAESRLSGRVVRIGAITLATILVTVSSVNVRAESKPPTEYEIKAACLYNFAKLIDWPDKAFADSTAPFSIGVLGRDPFGVALERAVEERNIDGREVAIRRSSGHSSCQMLYISASEKKNLQRVLEHLQGSHVVTVSDLEGFVEQGGMIGFYIEDNSIRFAVNVDAADRAGVEVDQRLLKLATVVRDSPPEEDTELAEE